MLIGYTPIKGSNQFFLCRRKPSEYRLVFTQTDLEGVRIAPNCLLVRIYSDNHGLILVKP